MRNLLAIFPILLSYGVAEHIDISCEANYTVSRIDVEQVGVNESSALELNVRCVSSKDTKKLETIRLEYPGKSQVLLLRIKMPLYCNGS